MSALLLFAALTVTEAPGLMCPGHDEILARLDALGAKVEADTDVRVRFSASDGKRVVEVDRPGAPPRRLEHDGTDCAPLGDATVALLSVLLDERPRDAPPAPRTSSPASSRAFGIEAAALVSSGIVASPALGASASVFWRPVRFASLSTGIDVWPAREHALGEGTVTVGAAAFALGACAGPRFGAFAIEGCALGNAGVYSLSAHGFAVVHSTSRALLGAEAAARAIWAFSGAFAVFVRAGAWLPLTPFDLTVGGTTSTFSTSSVAPKAAIGCAVQF